MFEFIIYFYEYEDINSSTTEMWDMPFVFSSSCTIDADKVGLLKMLSLWRLALNPLLPIASTTNEKHDGFTFQSVVVSFNIESPQLWKLRSLVLNLRSAPKSRPEEQWMQQKWNIIFSVLWAALTTICRSFVLKSMYLK